MDGFVLSIFTLEIGMQCRFILRGQEDLARATAANDADGMWYALQAILVAAANASKLLWGNRKDQSAERAVIREALGVRHDWLLRDRHLRNDFEHVDQRLADYFSAAPNRSYVGRNIGPPDGIRIDPPVPRFHHYDPTTGNVTFWNNSFSIPRIVEEARTILAAVERVEQAFFYQRPQSNP